MGSSVRRLRDGWWRRATYVLPALALWWMSDGHAVTAATANAPATATSQRQVLRSFPAAPYAYELIQEACSHSARGDSTDESDCAFRVNLVEGGKVLDRVRLTQAGCGPASSAPISLFLGVDRDAKAWGTSDDNCDVQVAAQTVDIGANMTALLVTELQGFEYRYRNHWLYITRNGKLETPWNHAEDSSGAHWTTTTVLPGTAGAQEIGFIDVARSTNGLTVNVTAKRLHVDPATGHVTNTPLPDASAPLYVLQAGQFASAKQVPTERQHCLHELVVMRANLFPGLKLPPFFFGAVFARRTDADAALAALAHCAEDPKANVVEYPVSKARGHARHH